MTKKNKRPHKVDEKADSSLTSNNKKQDDKNTPTKTSLAAIDEEMNEIEPTKLTYNDEKNKTLTKQNSIKKIIIHEGYTSTEWCASGTRCRNDKFHSTTSKDPKICVQCQLVAHPECLCEQVCMTCDTNIMWNSYTRRWMKLIKPTISNKDSSLQKASTTSITTSDTANTIKMGSSKWCGSKELCRNLIAPADGNHLCSVCLTAIHFECIEAGEDDSEYICVGCNKKPKSTNPDHSVLAAQNNTVIISEDGSDGSHKSILQNTNLNTTDLIEMDTDDAVGGINRNNNTMETVDEEQHSRVDNTPNNKKKESPVARGSGRITKSNNNYNQPRPNRSLKYGEFLLTRFELRVHVTPTVNSGNNLNNLRTHLVEIVKKLIESDNTVKVVPWKGQPNGEEIDAQNTPNTQPGLNKYFNRIFPRAEGFVYVDVRLKHKRSSVDIINDISLWLSNQQHGLYFQTLQSEETSNIGWLLWSFRKIDSRKLEDEIWELYGINVALKYQTIATSMTRGNSNGTEQPVKALHIWTTKADADRAAHLFNFTVYSDKAAHFPLGIVLRFIPVISRMQERLDKFRAALSLQQTFLHGIEGTRPLYATSWEITVLDQKKDNCESLRKLIMGVESKKHVGKHLFLSVDVSYFRSNEVLFSFLPRHEYEAREFITNLVPFIINTVPGETVKSYFHPEAVDRAMNCFWDNEKQEVVTIFDKYMEDFEILDDYAEDFLLDKDIVQDSKILTNASLGHAMSKVERILNGEENDSIGTLMTSNTLQPPNNPHTPSSGGQGENTSDTANVGSNISTMAASVATGMSHAQMEANIVVLNKNFSTIENVVLLLAKHFNLDINTSAIQPISQSMATTPVPDSPNENATSSTIDEGCNKS